MIQFDMRLAAMPALGWYRKLTKGCLRTPALAPARPGRCIWKRKRPRRPGTGDGLLVAGGAPLMLYIYTVF